MSRTLDDYPDERRRDGAPLLANGTRARLHGIAVTHLRSSDGASAIIADHGAHLLSWCPAGAGEALYLSPGSRYGAAVAIRGGVPVIFPQFGEQGSGKRHGIARVRPWTLLAACIENGAAVARLALQGRLDGLDGGAEAKFDADADADAFRLALTVRLQGPTIRLELAIENVGSTAWSCQAALHTYLRVEGLEGCAIEGLQGRAFIDSTAGGIDSLQADATLGFAGEVDRIYPQAPSRLLLRAGARHIGVAQHGFADTVVWNPGAVKASALTDLPAPGYREFVCIEAAAVVNRLTLAPAARWCATQELTLLPGSA